MKYLNPPGTAKILLFDIEATQLKADFGHMLSFGWKWFQKGQAKTIDLRSFPKRFERDPTDDRELVAAAKEILMEADIWVTWYGTYFDVPFIQTRLLDYRMSPLPPTAHDDGWKIARYGLKLHSNRLLSVSEFLGVSEKTPLLPRIWRKASVGHGPSIKYISDHCRQDVKVLEEVYELIRPYAKQHTNVNLTLAYQDRPACPVCGDHQLRKQGERIARTSVRQRYQCANCGTWSTGPSQKKAAVR